MEKAILKVAEELRNIRKELQHLNRTLEHSDNGIDVATIEAELSKKLSRTGASFS